MKTRETFKFKAGDQFSLDDIYAIQGLAGGDWWDRVGDDLSEDLFCTRDITITITVVDGRPDAPARGARQEE